MSFANEDDHRRGERFGALADHDIIIVINLSDSMQIVWPLFVILFDDIFFVTKTLQC